MFGTKRITLQRIPYSDERKGCQITFQGQFNTIYLDGPYSNGDYTLKREVNISEGFPHETPRSITTISTIKLSSKAQALAAAYDEARQDMVHFLSQNVHLGKRWVLIDRIKKSKLRRNVRFQLMAEGDSQLETATSSDGGD